MSPTRTYTAIIDGQTVTVNVYPVPKAQLDATSGIPVHPITASIGVGSTTTGRVGTTTNKRQD
jgi:hypothetical protein